MTLPTLHELYAEVTESLLRAEQLEDSGNLADAVKEYLRVSMLEAQIAEHLPATDEEGAVARRGAVAASLSARMPERALDMAAEYAREGGSEDHLDRLRELEDEARGAVAPPSDPEVHPGARFRIPDHAA